MNRIKMLISSTFVALALLVAPLGLVPTVAAVDYNTQAACGGANGEPVGTGTAANCASSGNGKSLPEIVKNIINIFSWVVGAVSVIMIIYGGFRYITSGGDQNGVKAAKDTLLYAIIGLVVVALSQVIVNFVLKSAINNG